MEHRKSWNTELYNLEFKQQRFTTIILTRGISLNCSALPESHSTNLVGEGRKTCNDSPTENGVPGVRRVDLCTLRPASTHWRAARGIHMLGFASPQLVVSPVPTVLQVPPVPPAHAQPITSKHRES